MAKAVNYVPSGHIQAGQNAQPSTQTSTPDPQKIEIKEDLKPRSSRTPYTKLPSSSGGGSAQVVFILMVVMLLIIGWQNVFSEFFGIVWGSSKKKMNDLPWKSLLGMSVFALLVVFIASINDDAAGIMMTMVLGIIAIYMIENKGGGITTLFNWLQKK